MSAINWWVDWRLETGHNSAQEGRFYWSPYHYSEAEGVGYYLSRAIVHEGLTQDFVRLFPVRTQPEWRTFWLESPLSPERCGLLYRAFARLDFTNKFQRESQIALLIALRRGRDGEGVFHAEFSRPGWTTFDRITYRMHCPRCRAASPLWSAASPETSINCSACGFVYVPATTPFSVANPFLDTDAQPSRSRFRVWGEKAITLISIPLFLIVLPVWWFWPRKHFEHKVRLRRKPLIV